jgi:hypothetical protein
MTCFFRVVPSSMCTRKRDRSDIGILEGNGAARAMLSGSGIEITAHFSRATGGTIGRLYAQSFGDFLLPFRLAEWTASLHAPAKRFQFLLIIGVIDPLDPIHWHVDRPRR